MDSRHSNPDGVDQAISKHRRRQKPRFPVKVRPRRERQSVESGAPLLEPEHLLPDAPAEIRRERYALAAISHAIVNAVVLAQMRQGIESVRDPPRPCMAHAHRFQLRKYARHHRPQARHAGERVLLAQSSPPPDYYPRPVPHRPASHHNPPPPTNVSP